MSHIESSMEYERLGVEHAIELYQPFLDERLYNFIPEGPPRSLEALQRAFKEFHTGAPVGSGEVWLNWAMRDGAFGGCLGTLQATRFADGLLWVGYKVIPSAWGKGVATTGLSWMTRELSMRLNGQPVLAAVDSRNAASIRVLEKCHFKFQRVERAELHGKQTEDLIFQYTDSKYSDD